MFFRRNLTPEQRERLDGLSPVILMGRGHSGTRVFAWACQTLGIRLGISASKLSGDAEDLKFTSEIKKIAINCFHYQTPEDPTNRELERLRQAIWKYYQKLGSPQGLWGWKFPETCLITPMLFKVLPRARFIHIVRDGRDIAFKRHLTDDPKRTLGKKILKHLNALNLPHHVQAALSWAYQVDLFDRLKSTLPPGHLLEIKFESMCLNPFSETQKICRFLNIPMTPECEHYLAHKINPKKVAQYKEHDAGEVAEVEKHIGPLLKRHGYTP